MADTQHPPHKKEGGRSKETLYVVAILVLAFAMVFTYARYLQPKEFQVNGIKIVSARPPGEVLPELVAQNPLVLREELDNANSTHNAVVGVVGAEIAGVFSENKRSLAVYGHVQGVADANAWVNCVPETRNCSGETLVIALDPCNCVRIDDRKIYVLFDATTAKLPDTRIRLRGLFNAALNPKK